MNHRIRRSGRRSMALVVTLVLVTLVSALLVAFVTKARLDLAAAASYAAVPQADGIARGGIEFVVGWLRREIRDGSTAYGTEGGEPEPGEPAAYAPLAPANYLPARTIERTSGALPYYQSLIKMSKRGRNFFEANNGWNFNGGASFDFVSDVSTKDPSVNGRSYRPERWRAPLLFTQDEAGDFSDQSASEDNLPDWVYVTREGPRRVTEIEENSRDESEDNPEYVLGRFAYAIYDISGLLDVSVAGHPGELEEYYDGEGVMAKSTLAWADPSVIQGVQASELVDWRHGTATQADFLSYVTNAAKEGFLTNAPGDNAFFSRSDLVSFAKSKTGQGVLDTNSLAYLTVFSREKNAPCWAPKNYDEVTDDPWASDVTVKYGDEAYDEGTTNRWAAGVLVKNGFVAPAPGIQKFDQGANAVRFSAGDPLLKRRFPLSRIDLLRTDSGADRALVQYYFGLVPSGQNLGPVRIWAYQPYKVGGGGSSGEDQRIYTLDEISEQGREPNFFELIAAAVLQGSLGKTGMQRNQAGNMVERAIEYRLARDMTTYHQILQIGANIIDQYDRDEWPTTIRSVVKKGSAGGLEVYDNDLLNIYAATVRGVENLPYISMIYSSVVRDIKKNSPKDWVSGYGYPRAELAANSLDQRQASDVNPEPNEHPWVAMFINFQLWNPNRNCEEAEPGKYRIYVDKGNTYLKPPRGLNGNNAGEPVGTGFPAKWEDAGANTYRQLHGYEVEYQALRGDFKRYGRNFGQNKSSIEFSTSSGGFMFDYPLLLKSGDKRVPIKVGDPARDIFDVSGASLVGLRLGETLVVNNLDGDKTNRWDFTRFSDIDNDGDDETASFGPTVFFDGQIPLVIELQKEMSGTWVSYYSLVPRRSGNQLNGFPRIDEHYMNWHDSQRLDAVYRRRWPVLSRFCPISDPRCGRFGFATGGGFTYTSNAKPNGQNWMKAGDRTLRYAPELSAADFKGTINVDSTRLDPESGWWTCPWEAGPYVPRPEEQNDEGNSIEPDDDVLFYVDKNSKILRNQVAPAELAENSQGQPRMDGDSIMWARGRDGLVRRGDGWRQKGLNPYSMKDQNDPSKNVARPIFLNRPFQSVAEMGYVLRDDPWKTLNFFWADSADAGLLDYFCLYEGQQFRPAVAGVVNPNTASKEVIGALIEGTAAHATIQGVDTTPRLSAGTAGVIAEKIREYLGNPTEPTRVLRSRGDIVEMCDKLFRDGDVASRLASDAGGENGLENTDTGRESLARALTDVCNTRTWNLFMDVVAQSGRFTQASRQAEDFLVTGERRLWVHLALDRLTGELVEMDIEPVFE